MTFNKVKYCIKSHKTVTFLCVILILLIVCGNLLAQDIVLIPAAPRVLTTSLLLMLFGGVIFGLDKLCFKNVKIMDNITKFIYINCIIASLVFLINFFISLPSREQIELTNDDTTVKITRYWVLGRQRLEVTLVENALFGREIAYQSVGPAVKPLEDCVLVEWNLGYVSTIMYFVDEAEMYYWLYDFEKNEIFLDSTWDEHWGAAYYVACK